MFYSIKGYYQMLNRFLCLTKVITPAGRKKIPNIGRV